MKSFVRIFLIILAIFAIFYGCDAQQQQGLTEADLILSPGDLLEQDLSGVGNTTILQQVGNHNFVDIDQKQQGEAKINLVKVLQSGDYNQIFILQNGSGNQTAVIQRGQDNFYDLEVSGYNNDLVVVQDGDRNRVIQDLVSTNDLKIEVVQQGSDNEVIQNLNGNNTQEFKVIQIGDGLKAIINQEGSN